MLAWRLGCQMLDLGACSDFLHMPGDRGCIFHLESLYQFPSESGRRSTRVEFCSTLTNFSFEGSMRYGFPFVYKQGIHSLVSMRK
jgi:hypothetical protein